MGKTLAGLQDDLVDLHRSLRDQLLSTDDESERDALLNEMMEVTHRVQLLGNLLFTRQTKALTTKVNAVSAAAATAQAAVAQFKKISEVLDSVTAVLGLADQAIDLAKSIAILGG